MRCFSYRKLTSFVTIVSLVLTCSLVGCGGGDAPSSSGNSSSSSSSGSSDSSSSSSESPASEDNASASEEEIPTEGWGSLKGKFIITGAPAPEKVAIAGDDAAFCGDFDLVNETVVAGSAGEFANVVLTLYTKRGDEPPTPHESYNANASGTVLMDNQGCRFVPHVTLLRTGQTLQIKNSDTVGHNTKIDGQHHAINPLIAPGQTLDEENFKQAERLPVSASCNIHPWMKAWLVVSDSPYMAVSDEKGEFLIENLPAGKHTFTVWQEKAGYLVDVDVNGTATEWARGRVEVIIRDGETTDLGDVTVTYEKVSS